MSVYYSEGIDGVFWTLTATLRCDRCSAEIATGRVTMPADSARDFPERADAARATSRQRVLWRASLVPGVRVVGPLAHAACAPCVSHAPVDASPSDPPHVNDEREWGHPDVRDPSRDGVPHIWCRREGGAWVVSLVVITTGLRFARSVTCADRASAMELGQQWWDAAPGCASAIRDAAKLYPRAAERYRAQAHAGAA